MKPYALFASVDLSWTGLDHVDLQRPLYTEEGVIIGLSVGVQAFDSPEGFFQRSVSIAMRINRSEKLL